MDKSTEKRLDAVVEDEVRRGYRIKDLPSDQQQTLQHEGGPTIRRVRFTRLNPGKRRKMAEVVQRQYHRDLKNADILSREQVLKFVTERGEWSDAMDKEMKELQERTNREMSLLFLDGAKDATWASELISEARAFRLWAADFILPDKRDETLAVFERWSEYSTDQQDDYTARFAASQERAQYSHDADLQTLQLAIDHVEAYGKLNDLDELRDKVGRVFRLQRDRIRLLDLQVKNAKIFADCVEQRRDNTEEMARVYFTTEQVNDADKPSGPLTETFDGLWDLPEDVVQWFLVESYFFQNGIPDEAREYLETFGFIKAERESADKTSSTSGGSEPSDASPVPPSTSSDTAAVEATVAASSASAAPTTSTTDNLPS
jgi:hypothetical protein